MRKVALGMAMAVAVGLIAGGASAQVESVNPEDVGVYTQGPITSVSRPAERSGQVQLFGEDWNVRVTPADPVTGPLNLQDSRARLQTTDPLR